MRKLLIFCSKQQQKSDRFFSKGNFDSIICKVTNINFSEFLRIFLKCKKKCREYHYFVEFGDFFAIFHLIFLGKQLPNGGVVKKSEQELVGNEMKSNRGVWGPLLCRLICMYINLHTYVYMYVNFGVKPEEKKSGEGDGRWPPLRGGSLGPPSPPAPPPGIASVKKTIVVRNGCFSKKCCLATNRFCRSEASTSSKNTARPNAPQIVGGVFSWAEKNTVCFLNSKQVKVFWQKTRFPPLPASPPHLSLPPSVNPPPTPAPPKEFHEFLAGKNPCKYHPPVHCAPAQNWPIMGAIRGEVQFTREKGHNIF